MTVCPGPEAPGSESVASGGGSAKTFSASVGGTVSVDAENVSKAKQIADKYGTVNGNSVEMTKKEFQNYLNTLEKNDIQYSHDVPDSELVDVEIVAN